MSVQRYRIIGDHINPNDDDVKDDDWCKYSDVKEYVKESNHLSMAKGCVLAAAEVCNTFDQPVIAQHILDSAGITDEELEQCADHDLEVLREAGLTEVTSDL